MKREKMTKEIRIKVPISLHKQFQEKCSTNYKTCSEVLRTMMMEYVNDKETKAWAI